MKKALYIITSIVVILSVLAVLIAVSILHANYYRFASCKEYYDVSKKADSNELNFMSFNIRGFTFQDQKEKSFYYRADLIIKVIKDAQPDIIAFQEAGPFELTFFKDHLLGYTYIEGYTTESRNRGGVITAIRSDRFTILDSGKFWISETPDVQSDSWGTACTRVALYANVSDNKTNKTYTITNTHLDHVSEEARINGVKLILERMKAIDPTRMVLLGDMNDFVFSDMYATVIYSGLNDAQIVAADKYLGPGATYHAFGRILNNARIDYFFLTPNITVNYYKVIDTTFDNVYPSDHFPIFMRISE